MSYVIVAFTLLFRAIYLAYWVVAEIVKLIVALVDGRKTYLAALATIGTGVVLIFSGHPIAGGVGVYQGIAAILAGLGLIGVRSAIAKIPQGAPK